MAVSFIKYLHQPCNQLFLKTNKNIKRPLGHAQVYLKRRQFIKNNKQLGKFMAQLAAASTPILCRSWYVYMPSLYLH